MVKNYIISAVRPIRSGWHLEKNRDLYQNYQIMYEISSASYRHFVKEPFESILLTAPTSDNDHYTLANWYTIKDLWHREVCNIFWAGADTIMTQPTSLFDGQFEEYRLFNYTDPKSLDNDLAHFYNDDVQYYPHTMSHDTWAVGELWWEYREHHPYRYWGFDQIRHNKMFWSQGIKPEDAHRPDMAWQAFAVRDLADHNRIDAQSAWNGLDIDQCHIMHFHASRGSNQVIEIMKTLSNKLGIPL